MGSKWTALKIIEHELTFINGTIIYQQSLIFRSRSMIRLWSFAVIDFFYLMGTLWKILSRQLKPLLYFDKWYSQSFSFILGLKQDQGAKIVPIFNIMVSNTEYTCTNELDLCMLNNVSAGLYGWLFVLPYEYLIKKEMVTVMTTRTVNMIAMIRILLMITTSIHILHGRVSWGKAL